MKDGTSFLHLTGRDFGLRGGSKREPKSGEGDVGYPSAHSY